MDFSPEALIKRISRLEKEVFALRKVAKAAKWQHFYHPDDTIEMLATALECFVKEFPEVLDN